jgi:hypothetical protein
VIVVLALMVAPLVVRRSWHIPVFGWVVATAIPAALWDRHLVDGLALLIALYKVAALRRRHRPHHLGKIRLARLCVIGSARIARFTLMR